MHWRYNIIKENIKNTGCPLNKINYSLDSIGVDEKSIMKIIFTYQDDQNKRSAKIERIFDLTKDDDKKNSNQCLVSAFNLGMMKKIIEHKYLLNLVDIPIKEKKNRLIKKDLVIGFTKNFISKVKTADGNIKESPNDINDIIIKFIEISDKVSESITSLLIEEYLIKEYLYNRHLSNEKDNFLPPEKNNSLSIN